MSFNERLNNKVETLITHLIRNTVLHAKFANTLSMLEYMGARKILKSQHSDSISFQTLSHAAEEIRHAQMLKKLALKLSDGKLGSYSGDHLLCGKEAKVYFQSIDQAGALILKQESPWKNYLLTTLFIEERAVQVYPVYERLLSKASIPNVLRSLIREEDQHLNEIRSKLTGELGLSNETLQELRTVEASGFNRFLDEMRSAC